MMSPVNRKRGFGRFVTWRNAGILLGTLLGFYFIYLTVMFRMGFHEARQQGFFEPGFNDGDSQSSKAPRIPRSEVLAFLKDPNALAESFQAIPEKDSTGKLRCLQFVSITGESLFARLGLAPGDCVVRSGGIDFVDAGKLDEFYESLKTEKDVPFSIYRGNSFTSIQTTIE